MFSYSARRNTVVVMTQSRQTVKHQGQVGLIYGQHLNASPAQLDTFRYLRENSANYETAVIWHTGRSCTATPI